MCGGTFAVNSGINTSGSWKYVNFGNFKVYWLFNTQSKTFGGNSWNHYDISLPVTYNKDKMAVVASGGPSDNAISVSPRVYNGGNIIRVSWVNNYGGSITCSIDINAILVDFT